MLYEDLKFRHKFTDSADITVNPTSTGTKAAGLALAGAILVGTVIISTV